MKTNIENTQSLLHDFGLSAKKTLGQNFLISQTIVNQIINGSKIEKDDIVIEIGPGIGALSEELCKIAKKVYLFEIDKSFEEPLHFRLKEYNNYELIITDFLKVKIDEFIKEKGIREKIVVVSNLPYYITSKLLLQIVKNNKYLKRIIVMMQKDVSDKILNDLDNKEKNTLKTLINSYTNKKEVCVISSENFLPKPHVDSSVLVFDVLDTPRYQIINEEKLEKKLNALFTQRRKTIGKNLSLLVDKSKIQDILAKCNISPLTRVEQLSEDELINLCNVIEDA